MIFPSNLACLLLALTAASSLNFAAAGDPPSLRARTSGPVALKKHPDHPKPLQLVAQLASLDSRSNQDVPHRADHSSSSSSSSGSPHRHRVRPAARRLLGSSSNVIQVAYSSIYPNTSAICPSGAGGVWDPIAGFGHLVSDNWVCSNPARPAKAHGGSAQDYVSLPNWETYGWAAFAIPAKPSGSPELKARLEGLNLHILGSVGLGSSGSCSVQAVDIAIFSDASGAPSTDLYNAKLLLPGDNAGSKTFSWSSNTSAALSFDIVDQHGVDGTADPPAVQLDFSATYWLRVKMEVPFGGDTGNAKCYVSWALNNVSKTGSNCLWQEAKGGASGYSTTCKGAETRAVPAATQTFATCFNGGLSGSAAVRRCLTYRTSVSTPVTCPAQFLDFNFASYGNNAAKCPAAPTASISNGTWPGSCANTAVGQNCVADCTYGPGTGGAPTVKCLVTGAWSTSIIGLCADPPTSCPLDPTATLTDGTWPASCKGAAINATCTADCTYPGGGATVQCLPSGQWETTATGSCPASPGSCPADPPSATLTNGGTWPTCAGTAVGGNCTATCPNGATGNMTVDCQNTGNWTSPTGSCN